MFYIRNKNVDLGIFFDNAKLSANCKDLYLMVNNKVIAHIDLTIHKLYFKRIKKDTNYIVLEVI